MRFTVVSFVLLAIARTAAAEVPPPSSCYLAFGGLAGIGLETVQAALTADGGIRLSGTLWGHASVAYGGAGDDQGSGVYRAVRAGIDDYVCGDSGVVCVAAGVDLGYQHVTWVARGENSSPDELHDDLVALFHVALDVGGKHVRVRPGLELAPILVGYDTVAARTTLADFDLTLAVAYRW